MKKTIYSILAVAAGVIMVSGCSKENSPVENSATGEITLIASLPDDITKASVDSKDKTRINWSAGDKISVFGEKSENNKFTLSSGAGTTSASFRGSVSSGTAKYALSPYNEEAEISTDKMIKTDVPSVQNVPAGSFDPSAAIIVGTVEDGKISFHHALAYLKITAPSDVAGLMDISLSSNSVSPLGRSLTGTLAFDTSSENSSPHPFRTANYVTIKPASGSFAAGAVYYAAVLPGTFNAGFTISYTYKDDKSHRILYKEKTSTKALTLSAGTAKTIAAATSFDKITVDCVQLWKDGPYWSTTNLGAESETDCGCYFAWGYSEGYSYDSENNVWGLLMSNGQYINQKTFSSTDFPYRNTDAYVDAAADWWDEEWTLPTDTDINNLISKDITSLEYVQEGSAHWSSYNVNGLLVTGKTAGYTGNSIFFPATGYGLNSGLYRVGLTGGYWVNVQSTDSRAYLLSFSMQDNNSWLGSCSKSQGQPIRPIRSSL